MGLITEEIAPTDFYFLGQKLPRKWLALIIKKDSKVPFFSGQGGVVGVGTMG